MGRKVKHEFVCSEDIQLRGDSLHGGSTSSEVWPCSVSIIAICSIMNPKVLFQCGQEQWSTMRDAEVPFQCNTWLQQDKSLQPPPSGGL